MSKSRGSLSRLVIGKESSYGQAVAGVRVLPFLSEGIDDKKERSNDMSLVGDAGYNRTFRGPANYIGPVSFLMGYGDIDDIIAAAMGWAGTPAKQTDLYYNQYKLATDLPYSQTFAMDKQVSVHEWAGVKINKLTIRGKASGGGALECEAEVSAKDRSLTSTTNTAVTIAALSLMDCPVALFEDLTFLIGDNINALVAGDEEDISSFELVIDNVMRTDELTNNGLAEQGRDGRRKITLKLSFAAYDSDQYITWRDNDTDLQAQLLFERDDGVHTDNYRFVIRIGKMQVTKYPTATKDEKMLRPDVEFNILRAQEESATWADMTEELEIDVVNSRSASPLA